MKSFERAARILLVLSTFGMLLVSSASAQFPHIRSMIQSGGAGNQSALAVGAGLGFTTNAYMLGTFQSSLTIGGSTLTNTAAFPNIFVAKFSNTGLINDPPIPHSAVAPTIDAPLEDLRFGVHGSVGPLVAGSFAGTNLAFGSLQISNQTPGLASDVFLGKYDENGNALWLKRYGGAQVDRCGDLAVDSAGNNYLAGSFESDSFSADGTPLSKLSTNGADSFVIKMDANGNVVWARQGSYAVANNVATDLLNNVYVAGTMSGESTFDGLAPTNPVSGQFVVKYNSSGTPIWARGDMNIGNRMVADRAQSIVSVGTFTGETQFGSLMLSNSAPATIFIAKYDKDGNALWVAQVPGSGLDEVTGMFVDSRTNYWVTGSFASPGEGGTRVNPRMIIFCYNQFGTLVGLGEATGDGASTGNGVGTFQSTISFMAGTFSTNVTFAGRSLTNAGDSELILARLGGIPPAITTTVSGTNLVQSWVNPITLGFAPSETFSLETSADLAGGWSPSTNAATLSGGRYYVTNSVSGEVRFYRLKK